MHRKSDTGQKIGSELGANNIKVTWEFTPEDLNFSLFGYFTSKDKNIGINRSKGNVWLCSLCDTFQPEWFGLFTLVYEGLLYFLESPL